MQDALDAIDRKILGVLQQDGRKSIAELAEMVGLSPSPCLLSMAHMAGGHLGDWTSALILPSAWQRQSRFAS